MIGHYLATALRSYRRSPVGTVMKVVALSLGLACFVGAYTVSDYFAGYDSQWANAGRIFAITQDVKTAGTSLGQSNMHVAAPVAKYLRADVPELEAVARFTRSGNNWTHAGDKVSMRTVAGVDPDFLKIFNLPFVAGDPLKALSAPKSVVVSTTAAKAMFGTTNVLGESLHVDPGVDLTITGVIGDIPPPSSFGRGYASGPFDLLVSMDTIDDIYAKYYPDRPAGKAEFSKADRWLFRPFQTYVLLPKDGSFTRSDLDRRLADFGARHIPKTQGVADFGTTTLNRFTEGELRTFYFGGKLGMPITTTLYLLGALVLGVACLDFANLATAEAGARAKEIGMRKTMGATRGQICVQTIVEVGILTSLSLVIALVAMGMVIPTYNQPVDIGMHMPGIARVDFWAGIAAILIGVTLVAGFYPALVLGRIRPVFALRMGTAKSGSRWLRAILIGAQFAATSFLVVAVAVVFIQNARLRSAGLGRTTDPVLLLEASLKIAGIDPETFRSQVTALPGIKAYTAASAPPIAMVTISNALYSRSPDPAAKQIEVNPKGIDYGFFKTIGVKVLAGREYSPDRDLLPAAPPGGKGQSTSEAQTKSSNAPSSRLSENILIGRSTAAALGWTPQEAVGKTIYVKIHRSQTDDKAPAREPRTVIGVVADGAIQFRKIGPQYISYFLSSQSFYPVIKISKSDIPVTVKRIETVWKSLAPDTPLKHQFIDEAFNQFYVTYSSISRASVTVALFAIVISAMGLVGMATFIVGRRRQEIGVRKTLGASTRQVLRLLLWEFSKPVIIGNLIAWPAAFFAVQLYLNMFVVRASLTLVPFLLSLLVTLGIAWVSVGAHAFRAARLKPSQVLRYE